MTSRIPSDARQRVVVVIPALNEERSVGKVLDALPRPPVELVVVVDNGSTDRTAETAREHGAHVVRELRRGYGRACLTGIAALRRFGAFDNLTTEPTVVVFLDADYSDYPEELPKIIAPILAGRADMVIGSRMMRPDARAALLPQARFGNWLACALMWMLYGVRFTDLGPFRAIRAEALERLGMADENFGWTVEMQIRAAKKRLRSWEVPVRYRERIGVSKVTGTFRGTVRAGYKILWTIAKYAV